MIKSILNGFYAFVIFNIIYFLGRGLIYLLDVIRDLNEDLIQGVGIEFIGAYMGSFYCLQAFTTGIKSGSYSMGFPAKFPKIVGLVFILLILFSRFFVFSDNNFLFYFKTNLTLNVISVIIIVIGAILGSIGNDEQG